MSDPKIWFEFALNSLESSLICFSDVIAIDFLIPERTLVFATATQTFEIEFKNEAAFESASTRIHEIAADHAKGMIKTGNIFTFDRETIQQFERAKS